MKRLSTILLSVFVFNLLQIPSASAEITVSHFIGSGGMGNTDGDANTAKFNRPSDLAIDSNGNTYVLDNNGIRKIESNNKVTTIYKHSDSGMTYCGITIDNSNNLWFGDCRRGSVYKVSTSGTLIRTITLPNPQSTWISNMQGIDAMPDGSILVNNWFNGKIHKISTDGNVSTYLQSPVAGGCNDYPKPSGIICPIGIAISPSGDVYVLNSGSSGNEILRVNSDLSTTKVSTVSNPNTIKFTNGALHATAGDPQGRLEWRLYKINGLFDAQIVLTRSDYYRYTTNGFEFFDSNNMMLTSNENQVVRKINVNTGNQTIIGNIKFGNDDGEISKASTFYPSGITEDTNGNIYFIDYGGVRKISNQGLVSTIYKSNVNLYSGLVYENQKLHFVEGSQIKTIDLNGAIQRTLNANITGDYPVNNNNALSVSPSGVIYLLMSRANDYGTKFIRKYDSNGSFTDLPTLYTNYSDVRFLVDKSGNLIVASQGQIKRHAGDNLTVGTSVASFFGYSQNIALANDTDLYVMSRDSNISALNLTSSNGTTQNLINGPSDSSINAGAQSGFSTVGGMLVSSNGNIYISDSQNHAIRIIKYTKSSSSGSNSNNSNSSNSGSSNTSKPTPPAAPSFRSFNVQGNTLNLQLNVNLGSKAPDKVYLIAPDLGITENNKSFAKIAGAFANWSITLPSTLSGKDLKLQFFSVKDEVNSEPLDRTIRIPAATPKDVNTSVPLPAVKAKSVISTAKVVITANTQPKNNAMPRSGYLIVPDSGITAENPLLGRLSGNKIIFTLPVLPAMAGNRIKIQIYLVNEMGDSKPLNLSVLVPKPSVPKVVIPSTPKVQTVICKKGNQTRTFAGKACPPGWN